jgi:antitoxin component of MazEF toxin-antitoxin module
MKAVTRARSVGGSLMVTIPKEIANESSISEGELIEIEVSKIRKSGFGILKGIGKFTEKDELDTEI